LQTVNIYYYRCDNCSEVSYNHWSLSTGASSFSISSVCTASYAAIDAGDQDCGRSTLMRCFTCFKSVQRTRVKAYVQLLSPWHNSFICCDQNVIVVAYRCFFYKTTSTQVIFMQAFDVIQLGHADENNAKSWNSITEIKTSFDKTPCSGLWFSPHFEDIENFLKTWSGWVITIGAKTDVPLP